ncbi:MAG: hypothetical protein IPJ49_06380 [Candidatus Obscuribacter sp.]|nr:hypothetical protein [Candidatus Obscuribacter sp.]
MSKYLLSAILSLTYSGLLLACPSPAQEPPAITDRAKHDLYDKFIASATPGWYQSLHSAPRFDEIAVSIDGHMSDNYLAFATAWQAKDKDRLLTLVEHAQPACKLYAAICLHNIDHALAQDAFTRLAESKETVQTGYACKISQDTVERIAKSYLRGRMPLVLPTPNNLRRTVELHYDQGMELLRAGKYQDALIELNKALSLHARSPKVLTARAQVYLKLGKKDLAKADNKLASSASDADKTYGLDAQGNPLKSDSIFEPRAKWK